MQIVNDDGTTRTLEPWEVVALTTAQEEYDREHGIVRQYSDAKADDLLSGILINMANIPEDTAIHMVSKYPAWESGREYAVGWRVRWGDSLYKVIQAHKSQDGWEPGVAYSLFAKILPGQDGEIGEWQQPDSTNPYQRGDKVTRGGEVWESLVDGNVWEPGVAGTESLWKMVVM